jgi:hypothetical protein
LCRGNNTTLYLAFRFFFLGQGDYYSAVFLLLSLVSVLSHNASLTVLTSLAPLTPISLSSSPSPFHALLSLPSPHLFLLPSPPLHPSSHSSSSPLLSSLIINHLRAQKKLFLDSMVNRGSTANAEALDAENGRTDTGKLYFVSATCLSIVNFHNLHIIGIVTMAVWIL